MDADQLLRALERLTVPEREIPGVIGALESAKTRLLLRLMRPRADLAHPDIPTTGRLLTVAEAAKKLQFTEQYVYSLARQQELPSVRCGRHVRFTESDPDEWIAKQSS